MNLDSIFLRLGISRELTQDLTLLLVVLLVGFLFGMFIGRHKLIAVLINIYAGVAIIGVIPEDWLGSYSYSLIIFLAIVVGMTFLGDKLFGIYLSGSGTGYLWRVFTMSFLEVVLFISVILRILPRVEAISYVSPAAYAYLATSFWPLVWMVLPLVFLIMIHERINR